MNLTHDIRIWALGVLLALGLASPVFAQAVPPSTTSDADPATRDAVRTGGCTGCFDTQMQAAISNFKNIKRVFRVCATGSSFTINHNCDGHGHGVRNDFVEMQGDLRDTNDPNNGGLGVPGGATNVTVRVAANGSGNGITCASASAPGPIGFIAPEGWDGVPNTADDAGGTGVFGAVGPGTNTDGGVARGDPNDVAAPLAACDTAIATTYNFSPPGVTPTLFSGHGTAEFCIVTFDQNGDAAINNDRAGAAAPGAITRLGGASATNETNNLKLTCDTAFADLPPTDFIQASLNTQSFKNQDTFGAQIFKLIASRDVHANGDATKKVQLAKPQIEGVFGGWSASSTCSWQQVGAQSGLAPGVASDPNTTDINVCYRTLGSGTREVFRNTWMANTKGDAQQGTGSLAGTRNGCGQHVGSITGTSHAFFKTLIEGGGTNDVKVCVQQHKGAVGYVDAFVHPDTNEFYSVPVDGVDADTADLKLLTRCGLYRYWGPLAGGDGSRLGVVTPFAAAHKLAMKTAFIYVNNEAYLPSNGLNYNKTATDGASSSQYVSTPAGAADACPGAIPAATTIP